MSASTGSEGQRDAAAAGIYVMSRTIGMALLVVTTVIANHLYDAAGWAYVAAIVLLYETALALGSLGLPDAVFYFIGRWPERAPAIVRQTSALLLGAAVPVIGVVAIAALLMSRGPLDLIPALPWLILVIVIELPTQPAVNQLIAHGRVKLASGLFVGFAALRTFAVLVPLLTGWSLTSIPMAMAVLGLTRLIAHVWILRRFYPLAAGQRWLESGPMREIFRFALPLGAAATVGKLNPQVDKYVAEFMLGTAAFSTYAVAAFELPLVTLIPYAIGAVMQVRYVRLFAAGEIDALRALWMRTVEKTMIIVIPLTVVLIVLARDIVLLVFDDAFVGATVPFQIFTVILLHRVAAYGPMLQAVGEARLLLVTSLLIIGSNLILSPILTATVGFLGPALATALANVPAWLLSLSRIGRALGGGIGASMPWAFYARTLVVCGSLGAALWAARRVLDLGPGANLGLGAAAYVVAYLIVGRLTGVLRHEDLAYLKLARRQPSTPA